jgi:FMN phosphatase YigB (HAD superfamily)
VTDRRPRIRWIVFDVGETLIDESRMWHEWADILEVPRFTFSAALGAVIARGEDHRRVFDIVAPGIDWRALRLERGLPTPSRIEPEDLYPDVHDGLAAIRKAGFMVGIAGNQPATSEDALAALGVPFDLVASSQTFGATKPDPVFFERLEAATGESAAITAYVGDRLDNDVEPARRAGMRGILLRRGPWATIATGTSKLDPDVLVVGSILGLLDVLELADARATARTDG